MHIATGLHRVREAADAIRPQARRDADAPAGLPPLRWAADAEGGAPTSSKTPNDPNRYVGFEVDLAAALERNSAAASSSSSTTSRASSRACNGATSTSP